MNNYDFSTLNDKEFELIAKDLLNKKFSLQLQHFKSGKDKGIDLRFSTSKNNNAIVVQVKHYLKSGYSSLKYTLFNTELQKVKKLLPSRYIIVTSIPLSAYQKDEIVKGMSPFILTANDVIGQEDLNSYLSEFKEIERKHFKLWFSSIEVFNSVINNAIEGRTKFLLEKIRKKIPFYVVTKKLDQANKILQKEKLLLITGQPGIGKTTLAEIILFERAKNNHKIYKVENITEAEDIISSNEEEKQLFYFDDFLGANYFEIINAHKTETQLTSFVERVKNTPNKYLILTTRTVILNHAVQRYEKISQSKLSNQQFELKLLDYDKYEKALILYNHIYFRKLRFDLYEGLLADNFYKNIIQHKNYTPRIIEFVTDDARITSFDVPQYKQFILNNLANPKEIWRYSFNNQIEYLDRCLLITLFTFDQGALENELLKAFDERLRYEKTFHNQIITTGQFNESIKILLNGFISLNIIQIDPIIRSYVFINPSLADFLIGNINESFAERKSIISSFIYVEQLKRFHPETSSIPVEKELQIIIRDRIGNNQIGILQSENSKMSENKKTLKYLEILSTYCREINTDLLMSNFFKNLNFEVEWVDISENIDYVLLKVGDAPETINFIKCNFLKIVQKLLKAITAAVYATEIPHYFQKFDQDYESFIESDKGFALITDMIERVLKTNEEDFKLEKEDEISNLDEVSEMYYELESIENELKQELFPSISISYDFGIKLDEDYWNDIITNNSERNDQDDDLENHYDDHYFKDSADESYDVERLIEDLFEKEI